jgi:tetratricopeptide (TPR) repeat protein
MRKIGFVVAILLAALASGCDSLHARMLAQEGVNLYHKGDVDTAAKRFEEAAKLDPFIPAIQLDFGFATLALYQNNPKSLTGQINATKSITAFEKYLQLKPQEERARVFLIQTFVDTGRYDEAVSFFKPAVEKSPPDGEALSTLGIIASKTGRYEEARGWYQKRISFDAKNADARVALGVLMWDFLHAHPDDLTAPDRIQLSDEALKYLQEAIDLNPKAPAAYTYANLVYRERAMAANDDDGRRKDLELANKFFKQAMEIQKGVK